MSNSHRIVLAALLGLVLVPGGRVHAADGLALTPPMGWNSWNKFGCNVSEQLIEQAADALVATGMKDAGYQYVVIDDCWQVSRDAQGRIVADPQRFPHGMPALVSDVHARGLRFGLYSDAGTGTCQKRPGSKDHEAIDAKTYAEWGVDYLKYDWCNTTGQDTRDAYARMSRALAASGRPIVFSICEWGSTKPWLWAQGVGQLWRATADIQNCWDCGRSWGGMGVVHIIDLMADLYPYAGPGHWNDPDMLEIGNGGLTSSESRAHFSFWALFAAPLMAGNDLAAMTPETHDILTNKEVIAVDQDPLGMQGRKVWDNGPQEVWMKPLANGARAVILFNRGTEAGAITVNWEDIGLFPGGQAMVRDLWKKADEGMTTGRYRATVGAHDVVMITVTPQ
jgi:alpha-galactosidase